MEPFILDSKPSRLSLEFVGEKALSVFPERFNEEGSTTIWGTPINDLAISLNERWNLISGIGTFFDISEMQDPDGLTIAGTFYGFALGVYSNEEFLEPEKGYWVRTNGSGSITLTGD